MRSQFLYIYSGRNVLIIRDYGENLEIISESNLEMFKGPGTWRIVYYHHGCILVNRKVEGKFQTLSATPLTWLETKELGSQVEYLDE